MSIALARQPILNIHQNTIAYELLFRNGTENAFNSDNPDAATLDVLHSAFYKMGIESVTNGKLAYINFTQKLLLDEYAKLLPSENVVIEILEEVEPTPDVVAACGILRSEGYSIALDDFVDRPEMVPLVEKCNILKVDIEQTNHEDCLGIAQRYGNNSRITLLAERVESLDDFHRMMKIGYSQFQGYFFSKPQMLDSDNEDDGSGFMVLELLK
jgi:c-di-GMP-related signal transduction protein